MLRFTQLLLFASVLLGGESISISPASQYDFPMPHSNLPQQVLMEDDGPIKPMKAALPRLGAKIPQTERDKWVVQCSSVQPNNDCNKTIDGSSTTFWQTKTGAGLPQTITIDLQTSKSVNALSMTPSKDTDPGGVVAGHKIYISLDNKTWSDPVAFGTWFEDTEDKFAIFEPQLARFVRFQATSASNATQFIRIADLGVWASDASTSPPPGLGRWGPTVNFPIVPVGVFIDPIGGKVVSFSTFTKDDFGNGGKQGTTWTATWDRASGTVSPALINESGHDMFCPGMAFDVSGNMFITGGKSASKTSIYNSTGDNWVPAQDMKTPRGYQGSTTCADGRIFVIGGSWQGGTGNKKGEIYDPKVNRWTSLDGCPPKPILTEDWEGEYRADNHVWLMAWKGNSIFHAGPSKDMHWITTSVPGAIQNAGLRGAGGLNDSDAMNGVAAMYNATEGKILTAGGAASYKYKNNGVIKGKKATSNAFVITLDQVNKPVNVKPASNGMRFPRTYHHAVILPNGDTFVVGGQIEGTPWSEDTPQLVPEIYHPLINTWTSAAPHSIIRVYHSFGLLLPDATVLVGGGGVCGTCEANHFDAQIYTPAYLLTANGDRAKRPVITKTSAPSVKPGGSLTITTDSDVVGASLVRYGGATHSLNNDQRRIELKLQRSGASGFQYVVVLPPDGGVALPGYWMLFVINAQGVPSEAKNVQILVA